MSHGSDNPLKRLIREIHRRSLWQVLGIYVIASWGVLQVVDTLGGALNLPAWFPSFAFALLLIGLPIVLATAFIQEAGPTRAGEGQGQQAAPAAASSGSARGAHLLTWRNAILGGVGAFALWGLVAAGWLLFGGQTASSSEAAAAADIGAASVEERPAVAVLPFQNMSGSEEDRYFTDGMHDEILTRLSKIGGLRVISRTSVLAYENPTRNLREIAGELGVGYIGEGSVRRAQEEVRITVQLIDATTDEHLWAETYDRELSPDAIFDIQSDVAQRIAEALRAELSPDEQRRLTERPTESQEAYDSYLLAQTLVQQNRGQDAIELFTRAVEIDPEFTDAWAELATGHVLRWWSSGGDRTEERRRLALVALERAEALDPDNVHYLTARADYAYYVLEDYPGAIGAYEEVITRDPNHGWAWAQLAYTRRRLGDMEAAAEAFTTSARLEPAVLQITGNLATTYSLLRRWDEAEAVYARYRAGWPHALLPWSPFVGGSLPYRRGDLGRARTDVEAVLEAQGEPYYPALRELARVALAERRFDEALAALEAAPYEVRESPESVEPKALLIAEVHEFAGRPEEARPYYERARAYLEERVREDPDDRRALSSLGLALAGLGERARAIELGSRATEILPVEEDAIAGPIYQERLARIYTKLGEIEAAIAILDDLLSRPSFLTVARLRMEPDWDRLRESPRFEALVERYG